MLGTFIESCEAQWLAGENIELADYLMAVNAQRRVLATIPGAMYRAARDTETLSDYLRMPAEIEDAEVLP